MTHPPRPYDVTMNDSMKTVHRVMAYTAEDAMVQVKYAGGRYNGFDEVAEIKPAPCLFNGVTWCETHENRCDG